ncbi:MAG: Asp-tRNA(Asn)/Glu-tRNA(Gln) amidotransferase subunit GatA [Proteobacteria bacterium]|nr:Asp-tRNA(Asn)/Glu-tRNA(Gln) amidotransferase subunit GatA [Pseudomonadota bacterium]
MSPDTLKAMSAALAAGETTAVALTEQALAKAEAARDLNAFLHLNPENALAAARAADTRRKAGTATALTGIPLAVKDIFCSEGDPTTAASKMLANWRAPYDATAVARLKAAGAVLIGKLNLDEFAMGASGENSAFGPTLNPWDRTRVPGGSSSGSAAAVAASIVPGTLGTDTGGSIRQPAAFCGLTGLKPTYGRVSRWGMIAFASSLDQGGALAWTAEDVAELFSVIGGHDPKDSTSAQGTVADAATLLAEPVAGLTLGVPESFFEAVDGALQGPLADAKRQFQALGVRLKALELPFAGDAVPAYYVLAPAEASTNLSRYDGVRFGHRCENPADLNDLYRRSRGEGFGPEVKRRILTGTYALSVGYYDAYYRQAQRVRRCIFDSFTTAFQAVDALFLPTTPTTAFRLGEKRDDPIALYEEDRFTIPANLAGLPALSLPVGFSQGLPVGGQLLAPHFREGRILSLAHAFQQATDYHQQRPSEQGATP